MGSVLRRGADRGCKAGTASEALEGRLAHQWRTYSLGCRIQGPRKQKWSLGKGSYVNKEFIQGPEGRSGKGASR